MRKSAIIAPISYFRIVGFLIFAVFANVSLADVYPAIGVYSVGGFTGASPDAACLALFEQGGYKDPSKPLESISYDRIGTGMCRIIHIDNSYSYISEPVVTTETCPGGGTLAEHLCTGAPSCAYGESRVNGVCQAQTCSEWSDNYDPVTKTCDGAPPLPLCSTVVCGEVDVRCVNGDNSNSVIPACPLGGGSGGSTGGSTGGTTGGSTGGTTGGTTGGSTGGTTGGSTGGSTGGTTGGSTGGSTGGTTGGTTGGSTGGTTGGSTGGSTGGTTGGSTGGSTDPGYTGSTGGTVNIDTSSLAHDSTLQSLHNMVAQAFSDLANTISNSGSGVKSSVDQVKTSVDSAEHTLETLNQTVVNSDNGVKSSVENLRNDVQGTNSRVDSVKSSVDSLNTSVTTSADTVKNAVNASTNTLNSTLQNLSSQLSQQGSGGTGANGCQWYEHSDGFGGCSNGDCPAGFYRLSVQDDCQPIPANGGNSGGSNIDTSQLAKDSTVQSVADKLDTANANLDHLVSIDNNLSDLYDPIMAFLDSAQSTSDSINNMKDSVDGVKSSVDALSDKLSATASEPGASGLGAGQFYISSGKTIESVSSNFFDKAASTPLLKAGRDVFEVEFPAGGGCTDCDLSIPAVMGMPGVTLLPFCVPWMPAFWSFISAALRVATVFMAIRIMITPTI